MLTAMIGIKELMPLIAPSIAKSLRGQSDAKIVEKVLLNAIREYPRNLGIILAAIDFYLHIGMPGTALKVIAAAKKNHDNPKILVPEEVQAHLMLNDVGSCIPLLRDLMEAKFMPDTANQFISRCLYAEGHIEDFMDSIGHRTANLDLYKQAWIRKSGESA